MGVIAKQSIRGTIVTYLGVFVGFLTTFFVLTRFLSAEEIGLARVLIDTATLFIGLAGLGTTSSIIRFWPYFKPEKAEDNPHANGFFFWTIAIPFFGFILFTSIYWAAHVPLQQLFSDKSPLFVNYYYAVVPLAFFMLYQTIFETNANVLMRIVWPRAVRELVLRIFLLEAYLLYAFRIVSLDGLVILISGSYALAALANIIYLFAFGHISLRPDFDYITRPLARKYILYTLFQITAALATVITPTLSSFFITAQLGLDYTGIFAIATYMAVMVSIPNRSLNAIANPQLAQTVKDGDRTGLTTLLRQVSSNSLLVGGFIMVFIWINIDLIFHILPNGETYETARYVVLILSVSQLLIATFNATISVLNYSKYYYLSLVYSFLLTGLSLWLNNVLIPTWGMNGAAMANLLSYTIYFALLCMTMPILCKTSPFSLAQLKTVVLLVVLWGTCMGVDMLNMNIWFASCLKSGLWLTAGYMAYRLKISPEINNAILHIL